MIIRVLTVLAALVALVIPASARPAIEHVFVVVMENKDATQSGYFDHGFIIGNAHNAPYINKELLPVAARASNFIDRLPEADSEAHYILMEAGTNEFSDTVFRCDDDPNDRCKHVATPNWTTSPDHLVSQLSRAGLTWRAYVQGLDPEHTGACPVTSAGRYAAKHVPFVFFADVAGSPPSRDNAPCAAHTRNFNSLSSDLASGDVPNYVFITPDLCADMHGANVCRRNTIRNGDRFLKTFLPDLIAWSTAHHGIVMLAWDEGDDTLQVPFFLAGAGVTKNYESGIEYDHRSMIRTVEAIFGLPALAAVKDAPDFRDMFEPGQYP